MINVVPGAAGTGTLDGFLSPTDGTLTTADGGSSPGTLSTGALAAVGSAVDISITALDSITFNDFGGLVLQTGAGHTASFSTAVASGEPIVFLNPGNLLATSGGSLTFSAGTDVNVGSLNSAGGNIGLSAGSATAGNISVRNLAAGAGSITLQATNATGGTISQLGTATASAINATARGTVVVDALGAATVTLTSTNGLVNSAGTSAIQAGAQLTVSAFSGINVFTSTPGLTASNSTSGDVSVVQLPAPALSLTAVGAGVVNTAPGGLVTLTNTGGSVVVNPGVQVRSNNGGVTLSGLDLAVNGTVNSGTAPTTLASPQPGRPIDLGTNTPGAVGITQPDLDNITAGVVRVGTGVEGQITVSLPITRNTSPLTLVNNGPVAETAGTITAANLRVTSTGPVALTNLNAVINLAGSTPNAFSFTNGANTPLTTAVVDGVTGVSTTSGTITLAADNQNLLQPVNAGTGVVTLQPELNTVSVNLGGPDAAGVTLGLSDAELGRVTAGVLRVGNSANTGGITVSAAITRHTGYTTLSLITGGTVTQTASLAVANLDVQATGNVTLTNAGNDADFLTAIEGTGSFSYTDANALTVGGPTNLPIDGITGITSASTQPVTVTTQTGNLSLEQLISAPAATVNLAATAGAIIDANDPPVGTLNVNAAALGMTASTGIGTGAGGAIDTQVANLEAQSNTGGVFISNTGNVTLAGVSAALFGIRAGTSGDIALTNAGTINITPTPAVDEDVQTPAGNVTLTATGATSSIVASGGNNTAPAVLMFGAAPVTTVTLTAGQDILLGNGATAGNVISFQSVSLSAGRDVTLDGGTVLSSGGANNPISVTAGRNITVTASGAVPGAIVSSSGATTLTTGVGGVFTLNSGAGGKVITTTGAVTVNADDIAITAPATITTAGQVVTLRQATGGAGATARNVDVGTDSAGNLGLTDAELGQVTAGVLRIGRLDNPGSINVSANFTTHAGYGTLSLLSGGSISEAGAASVAVTSLAAQGAAGVNLTTITNQVATVAGAVSGAGAAFAFKSAVATLTVGTVDGAAGITTNGGAVNPVENTFAVVNPGTPGSLTVTNAIRTTGGSVNLFADNVTVNAAVNAGTGTVRFDTEILSRPITVGTKPGTSLGLLQSDLNQVTAGVVRVGDETTDTGGLTVTAAVVAPAGWNTLDLRNQGLSEVGAGSLRVTKLALHGAGAGGITFTSATNAVPNLAFTNTGGAVSFTDSVALTVSSVAGLTASSNTGTTTTLTTAGATGPLALTFAVNTTSTGTLTATAGEINDAPVWADNLTVNPGVTVEVTGGNLVLQAGDSINLQLGGVVTCDTGTVTLTAGFNDLDGFGALNLPGTINSPAADLTLQALNDIVIGTVNAAGHTVTVTTTTGQITDGNDPPAGTLNITADKLAMQASIGIGVGGSGGAIETQVNSLEAQTNTGGIAVSNTGALAIGGVSGALSGVQVTTAPGDITVTATGTITVATDGDTVRGPGNVTVQALGATSDVLTGGQSSQTSIRGLGAGLVTVQAGRDLLLGDATGFGTVRSVSGTIALSAGRDVVVNANAAVTVLGGPGGLTATAGRNITMMTSPGNLVAAPQFATTGGPIALTTGTGGTFTAASTATDAVSSLGGAITVSADDMVIAGGLNAGSGAVTLQQAIGGAGATARIIDLGGGVTPGDLGLSDAELGQVTAGVLRVGRMDNAGNLVVTAPVTAHAGFSTLSLRSGGAITEPAAGDTIAVTNLAAVGQGVLLNQGNTVTRFAGAGTAAGQSVFITNAAPLTVGAVDGVTGITTASGGTVVANVTAAGGLLTVSSPIASGNALIVLRADDMALNAAVNAGTGGVNVIPQTAGETINLGSNVGGQLGLTNAELNQVTAGTLTAGTPSFTGNITVSAPISPANVGILWLNNSGAGVISQAAGATITVAGGTGGLIVQSGAAVTLTEANDVATLAAAVTGPGNDFTYTDANALAVGSLKGVVGVTTNAGMITVATTNGNLTVNNNVNAGANFITLAAGGANSTFRNNAAVSNSGGFQLKVTGDRMALNPGSSITAAGGGRVLLGASIGRLINLGSTTDAAANTLELSGAELNTVTTTGVLQVGFDIEGDVTVSAPIAPAGVTTLAIETNGGIAGPGPITVPNLSLVADTGTVNLPGSNAVGTLSAETLGAGQTLTFNNAGNLTVGDVDSGFGVFTNAGNITLTATGDLTINSQVNADGATATVTAAGAGHTITNNFTVIADAAVLTADRMILGGGSVIGNVSARLQPFSAGRLIDLGSTTDAAANTLELSGFELNTVSAPVLRIGGVTAGNLTVTAPIAPTGATALALVSGGTVTQTAPNAVTVTDLALEGAAGVNFAADNVVTEVAGTTSTAGAPFTFHSFNSLTVGSVDGVNGITTNGGQVSLAVTNGGSLTVSNAVTAGNTNVLLSANNVTISAGLNAGTGTVKLQPFSPGVTVNLGGADVPLTTLGLADAELDNVTAGLLTVGDPTLAIPITVTGAIDAETHYGSLLLATTGSITQGGPAGLLAVPNLALRAGTGIGSATPLLTRVSNLAAVNSTSGHVQVSNTGGLTLPAAGVAGVVGVTENAAGDNVRLSAASPMAIASAVSDTGGGDITLTTTGANGAITVTATGSVTASGGNGSITLDASAATSGGTVTVNNGPNAADISAAGTGNIALLANDAVVLGPGAVIQSGLAASGGGTVTLNSNAADVNGTDDITIGAGAQILTRGNVFLDADPDGNGVGGALVFGAGSVIGAPGGGPANTISLTAAGDVTLATLRAAAAILVDSTAGNIRDDGNDTTFIQAPTITLTAARAIGGDAAITPNDVLTQAGNFPFAIDFALQGGPLVVSQTGAGGNIQLRQVGGPLVTSALGPIVPAGTGRQLALIAAGGALTVGVPLTLPAGANANLLLASTGGDVQVSANVTNSAATSPTTLVATVGGIVGTPATAVVGQSLDLVTNGGAIGAGAANPLRIDATNLDANSAGGGIAVTDVAGGVAVGQVTAGLTGDVTLTSLGNSLTSRFFNDFIPDVTGRTVTLNVTGPANGATGQIGSFGTTAQFFEVQAQTLNASTNNSRLWIAVIGNALVGHISAGTETAVLREVSGVLKSAAVDGSPDVVAGTALLRGVNNGSFGDGAAPLEVDVGTLNASTDGTGLIDVTDTGGGMTVDLATTNSGPITLATQGAGGNMTLGTVSSGSGVTLSATGAITQVPGDTLVGTVLTVPNATGFGTAATPVVTTTGSLTANAGSVFVNDIANGGMTINGVTSGGPVSVATIHGPLTVAQNVTAAGDVSLTSADLSATPTDPLLLESGVTVRSAGGAVALTAGGLLTVPAGAAVRAAGPVVLTGGNHGVGGGGGVNLAGVANGSTVAVLGGTGNDIFVLNPAAGSSPVINVDGQAGPDSFNVTPSATTTFFVNGGAPTPPASPGDTLNVDTAGTANPTLSSAFDPANGAFGTWTFGNRRPVNFAGMEAVSPSLDLSAAIASGFTSPVPGSVVTYSFEVTNHGPDTATGALVTAPIPAGVTVLSYTSSAAGGATGNTASGTGAVSDTVTLPAGATIVYTFTAQTSPSATGNLQATLTVTPPAGSPELTPADNTATITSHFTAAADLKLAVNTVPSTAHVGGNLTYVLTVTNTGPSDAQGVTLTAALPAQFKKAVAAATQGSVGISAGNLTAVLGSLPAGASATVTVTGTAAQEGTAVLTATVASSTADPNTSDNAVNKFTPVTSLPAIFAVGAGAGGGPQVSVYDAATGALRFAFFAYDPAFTGGVRVATADLTGDGVPDIVTAPGPGGGPDVRVFDGATGAQVAGFFAYDATFTGGVNVAAGDVTGDGVPDIVTGAGPGGGPNVKAFRFPDLAVVRSFFAYDAAFTGGVNVAAGDVNGDGVADIVTGAGPGGGPDVKVFSGATGAVLQDFFAFDAAFTGGVSVAVGDFNGDGRPDVAAGAGAGGGPAVRVFDAQSLALEASFFAYDAAFTGGVRVGAVGVAGSAADGLVVGAGASGGPQVELFQNDQASPALSFFAFDPAFLGGVYVG
jgi:hypothetical protein